MSEKLRNISRGIIDWGNEQARKGNRSIISAAYALKNPGFDAEAFATSLQVQLSREISITDRWQDEFSKIPPIALLILSAHYGMKMFLDRLDITSSLANELDNNGLVKNPISAFFQVWRSKPRID